MYGSQLRALYSASPPSSESRDRHHHVCEVPVTTEKERPGSANRLASCRAFLPTRSLAMSQLLQLRHIRGACSMKSLSRESILRRVLVRKLTLSTQNLVVALRRVRLAPLSSSVGSSAATWTCSGRIVGDFGDEFFSGGALTARAWIQWDYVHEYDDYGGGCTRPRWKAL